MSTPSRFLLSIGAVLIVVVVTSSPAAGQGDRGGGAAVQGGAAQGGRGGRAGGAPAPAGPIPRRPDGKPDLTGNWMGSEGQLAHTVLLEAHPGGFGITAGKSLIIDPPDGMIPYQSWALAERNRRREDANAYEDPVGHCEFYDIGRVHSFAQAIWYSGNNIIIDANQHLTRVVDMSRRAHLPEGIRLWEGDPIGRWDGDTLVIESTNFNGKPRMAIGGDFYGPDAVIVERFTMANANTINWTMTITNPKVFTRPWTMTSALPMARTRQRENVDGEDACHEQNVDLVHLKNLYDQTHPAGSSLAR